MSISRISVLAVFFMMVMSAFVTVPAYNVGADEGGCMDYEDTNDNGLYDEGEPCYDDDDGDRPPGEGRGCMDYDDTNENGLYDEGEPCYDDDDELAFTHFNGKIVMESLGVWNVTGEGQFPQDESDEMRQEVADFCAYMLGTAVGTIDKECFDYFLESMDDDHDELHCPAAMDDETCEIMKECSEDSHDGNIACAKNLYDYCKGDGSSDMMICGQLQLNQECYDDDGNEVTCPPSLLYAAFDYENAEMTASDFVDVFMSVYGLWLEEINKYVTLKATPFEDVYHITEENKSNSYLVDLEFINLNVSNYLNYSWQITQLEMTYYCSNDSEEYAESMGGILCPEGPDVVPMCPNDEPCVCIDIDSSCDDDDDDWGYSDGTYSDSALVMPYWNESNEWTNGCYKFEAHAMNGPHFGAHDGFIFGVGDNSTHCHMMNDHNDHGDHEDNDDDDNYIAETILDGYIAYIFDDDAETFATNMTELLYIMFSQGDDDDHGDEDDHDSHDHDEHGHDEHDDEEPMILDGIKGVQNPEDPDCEILPDFVSGSVADNAGKSITCSIAFTVTFEGADESLAQHKATLLFDNETEWHVDIEMLEGYEFISCEGCESSTFTDNKGNIKAFDTVNLTFGKVVEQEPVLPDCDHVIGLDSTGMAFDPVKLSIKVGETVCWQWKDASMAHNVLELEAEYDSNMNLTNINFGFSSGEPSITVDFRHTFTKDNMTHYYVCEPHAPTGMVGQIKVGEGLADDPVQQALDDNEVPSIGFVVGSLVLVGAAGLRRRIH